MALVASSVWYYGMRLLFGEWKLASAEEHLSDA